MWDDLKYDPNIRNFCCCVAETQTLNMSCVSEPRVSRNRKVNGFLGFVIIRGKRDPLFKVYPIRSSVTTCINLVQKPTKSTVKGVISVDCNVNDRAILLWYKKPLTVEFLTNENHE